MGSRGERGVRRVAVGVTEVACGVGVPVLRAWAMVLTGKRGCSSRGGGGKGVREVVCGVGGSIGTVGVGLPRMYVIGVCKPYDFDPYLGACGSGH